MNIERTAAYKAMINRGDDPEDAKHAIKCLMEDMTSIIESGGGSLLELEDLIADHLGLEPDYLEDFLYGYL